MPYCIRDPKRGHNFDNYPYDSQLRTEEVGAYGISGFRFNEEDLKLRDIPDTPSCDPTASQSMLRTYLDPPSTLY